MTTTDWYIVAVLSLNVLLVVGFDTAALCGPWQLATITERVGELARAHPVIPALTGLVVGGLIVHLFRW